MGGIFISYRREDSAGHSGRLFDALANHFHPSQIFMDVDSIEPGEDFPSVIERRIANCDVLLAIIGRRWLAASESEGRYRMDDPNDYVRRELELAQGKNIPILPILVGAAAMPSPQTLPTSLDHLSRRQAYVLDDADFHEDVNRLIPAIERAIARSREEKRRAASVSRDEQRRAPKTPSKKSAFLEELGWWLLLYVPDHWATWILHGVFFMLLAFLLLVGPLVVFVGAAKEERVEVIFGILAGVLAFLVPIRALAFVIERDRRPAGRFRRWLLLYRPGWRATAFLHIAFVLLVVISTLMCLAGFAEETNRAISDVDRYRHAESVVLLLFIALMIRDLAASRDPLLDRAAPRTWFSQFFYVWKPLRPFAWFPRLIFFAAVLAILFLLPNPFLDSRGNFRRSALNMDLGEVPDILLLIGIAISARGWARTYQMPRRRHEAGFASRVLHALVVRPDKNRSKWAACVLFYSGIVFTVLILSGTARLLQLIGADRGKTNRLVLWSVILSICSRGWAMAHRGDPQAVQARAAGAD